VDETDIYNVQKPGSILEPKGKRMSELTFVGNVDRKSLPWV
jgi:hypothetical protein